MGSYLLATAWSFQCKIYVLMRPWMNSCSLSLQQLQSNRRTSGGTRLILAVTDQGDRIANVLCQCNCRLRVDSRTHMQELLDNSDSNVRRYLGVSWLLCWHVY